MIKKYSKDILMVISLAVIVWVLQSLVFAENLKYGFRDGDWFAVYNFYKFGDLSLDHLMNTWKVLGAYVYQLYYPGFLTKIYGLSFPALYQASHFFKFLATLSIFPMVYIITKNRLTAFVSTIIYAVAYPTAGALYMLATGAYFVAIIFLNCFIALYWLLLQQNRLNIKRLLLAQIILTITFILGPERMYPLILIILISEVGWILKKSTKLSLIISLKRVFILMLPFIIFYVTYAIWLKDQTSPGYSTSGFLKNVDAKMQSIISGNWQLLLYPFSSFGSMFLYGEWWKFFGNLRVTSFFSFIFYFLIRPMLIFCIATAVFAILASKRPLKMILETLIPVFIFGIIIFILANHWNYINPSSRIYFDLNLIGIPALFGFYIISLSTAFFNIWLKDKDLERRSLYLPLFLAPAFSFILIFLTWIPSDIQLIFMGPQRYLTTPAIGSSLFLASLMILVFTRLKKMKFTKNIAWVSLLTIIPIVLINANIVNNFFDYELNNAGMNGVEQTRMKNEFWSYVPKMSNSEKSLFYFDETKDKENGYFDESTILAGFDVWTLIDQGKQVIKERPVPGILRTNIECEEVSHESCIKLMKRGLTNIDGEEGILYADKIRYPDKPRFYKLKNFYSFRFINRHLVNIREEVLKELHVPN